GHRPGSRGDGRAIGIEQSLDEGSVGVLSVGLQRSEPKRNLEYLFEILNRSRSADHCVVVRGQDPSSGRRDCFKIRFKLLSNRSFDPPNVDADDYHKELKG